MALRPLAGALLIAGLAACARPDTPPPRFHGADLATDVLLTSVPFHPQALRNDCGPAALAMMLGAAGIQTDPVTVAPAVYTPGREGTLQADIVQASRRAARLAVPVRDFDALLAELDAGHPVLVLQNLGLGRWPQWHYAVAIGYDLDREILRLHSGATARHETSFDEFDRTWRSSDRWALTITEPHRLPAHVDLSAGLKAASGLEQAGQSDAAAIAYGRLLDRWPDSLAALMGFGNARYAAGNTEAARQAFRHAVTRHPNAAEAWNNLAVTLADAGRYGEAVTAARKAIDIGGPHRAAARQTLAEVEARAN